MSKLFLILAIALIVSSCNSKQEDTVTIATAANMQYVMAELTNQFEVKTGVKCQSVIGSSGKLTAQISEGAPYDIFVSADMNYPNVIFEKGLSSSPPKVYAHGTLVLWSYKNNTSISLDYLLSEAVNRIAIPNEKTAPYGKAAVQVLKKRQLFDFIESKLVFGESISQTNQFITSESAEVGFTSKSVVLSPKMKGKGSWIEVDSELYLPIEQGVILLTKKEQSEAFYEYLFSKEAQEILKDYGYLTALNNSDVSHSK